MALIRSLIRRLKREHDCYWRRQYDTFNEAYQASRDRAAELEGELTKLREASR